MEMDRRSFLTGVAAGLAGGTAAGWLAEDIIEGDSDLPFRISAATYELLDDYLEPGQPVPDTVEDVFVPEDYQDYIDPSLDVELERLADVPYDRDIMDWKRPREYIAEGGDCEDYATAAASVLERKGKDPRVIIGSLDGIGHVLVEDEDGQVYDVGAGATEVEDWDPVLMFSKDEDLQAYRPPERS